MRAASMLPPSLPAVATRMIRPQMSQLRASFEQPDLGPQSREREEEREQEDRRELFEPSREVGAEAGVASA